MLRFATPSLYFAHGPGTVGINLVRVVDFRKLQNCRSPLTEMDQDEAGVPRVST
jgi:hypothetical protein